MTSELIKRIALIVKWARIFAVIVAAATLLVPWTKGISTLSLVLAAPASITSVPTSRGSTNLIFRSNLTDTLFSPDISAAWRFWDVPPTSGSVIFSDNQQIAFPGPDDRVRVIVQLYGDPVAVYALEKLGRTRRMTNAEMDSVRQYGDTLAVQRQQMLAQLRNRGITFKIKREFGYLFNGMALSIRMDDWRQIESMALVKAVYPDYQVHANLKESVPLIGAPGVWAMTDPGGLPVTGLGMRVAIIDTGIDYTHPDLGGCFGLGCRVISGFDFVNNDHDPMDDHGHGTHVAGDLGANGLLFGVAPDVQFLAYKVLDHNGLGETSDVIAAIERAANPDGDPATSDAVDVMNLSLDGPGGPDDPECQAVDYAASLGVVMTAAAANSGSEYQSIESPGVCRKAFTVGASDKGDFVAGFSSRGPLGGSWAIKPDILAPGVSIRSTVPLVGQLGWPSRYRLLSGTSVATPHIAGSAVLIKQLHPDWTPAMIQASLMNTARNLGVSVFAQGAGREHVDRAVAVQAMIIPGSLSLGNDDLTQTVWITTTTFHIQNVSAISGDYALSISGTLPTGISASIEPTSVNIAPGTSAQVNFSITVDNRILPVPTQKPHAYQGFIVAQSTSQKLTLPFAFVFGARLHVTFDQPVAAGFVWVHNRSDGYSSFLKVTSGSYLDALIPPGIYDLVIFVNDEMTWIVREGVEVSTVTSLSIDRSEATYKARFLPRDEDNQAMEGRFFLQQTLKFRSNGQVGFKSSALAPPFETRMSAISSDYIWEWSAIPVTSTAFYHFVGAETNGISRDVTFQNEPGDFTHVTHRFSPDPEYSEIFVKPQVGFPWTGLYFDSHHWVRKLIPPFVLDAYLISSPYSDFSWGYNYLRGYDRDPSTSPDAAMIMRTPYLFNRGNGEIQGILPDTYERTEIFTTTSQFLDWQLAPPHWFGRFENNLTEVKLWPAKGDREWLFLQQGGDVRPHDNLPYELYQNGELVKSGTLSGIGNPSGGSKVDDLRASISLPGPGVYSLTIPYSGYYLNGRQGLARMTAEFDTLRPDINPPTLISLNVLANGDPTDVITSTGEVCFSIEDDLALGPVSLYRNTTSGWVPMPLTDQGDGNWVGHIPCLIEDGFVALKLAAQDEEGNKLTFEADPALMILPHSCPLIQHQVFFPLVARSLPPVLRPQPGTWSLPGLPAR